MPVSGGSGRRERTVHPGLAPDRPHPSSRCRASTLISTTRWAAPSGTVSWLRWPHLCVPGCHLSTAGQWSTARSPHGIVVATGVSSDGWRWRGFAVVVARRALWTVFLRKLQARGLGAAVVISDVHTGLKQTGGAPTVRFGCWPTSFVDSRFSNSIARFRAARPTESRTIPLRFMGCLSVARPLTVSTEIGAVDPVRVVRLMARLAGIACTPLDRARSCTQPAASMVRGRPHDLGRMLIVVAAVLLVRREDDLRCPTGALARSSPGGNC